MKGYKKSKSPKRDTDAIGGKAPGKVGEAARGIMGRRGRMDRVMGEIGKTRRNQNPSKGTYSK